MCCNCSLPWKPDASESQKFGYVSTMNEALRFRLCVDVVVFVASLVLTAVLCEYFIRRRYRRPQQAQGEEEADRTASTGPDG
jgi:hypothetical protein